MTQAIVPYRQMQAVKPYWVEVDGGSGWDCTLEDFLAAFDRPDGRDELFSANAGHPGGFVKNEFGAWGLKEWRGRILVPGSWSEPKAGPVWEHVIPFSPEPTKCDAGKKDRRSELHTVKAGEQPWDVAALYGLPYSAWVELRQANHDYPAGFERPAKDCGMCFFKEWGEGKQVWIPASWPSLRRSEDKKMEEKNGTVGAPAADAWKQSLTFWTAAVRSQGVSWASAQAVADWLIHNFPTPEHAVNYVWHQIYNVPGPRIMARDLDYKSNWANAAKPVAMGLAKLFYETNANRAVVQGMVGAGGQPLPSTRVQAPCPRGQARDNYGNCMVEEGFPYSSSQNNAGKFGVGTPDGQVGVSGAPCYPESITDLKPYVYMVENGVNPSAIITKFGRSVDNHQWTEINDANSSNPINPITFIYEGAHCTIKNYWPNKTLLQIPNDWDDPAEGSQTWTRLYDRYDPSKKYVKTPPPPKTCPAGQKIDAAGNCVAGTPPVGGECPAANVALPSGGMKVMALQKAPDGKCYPPGTKDAAAKADYTWAWILGGVVAVGALGYVAMKAGGGGAADAGRRAAREYSSDFGRTNWDASWMARKYQEAQAGQGWPASAHSQFNTAAREELRSMR